MVQTSARLLLLVLAALLVAGPGAAYDRKEWPTWSSVGTWKTDDGTDCRADVRDAVMKRQALPATLTIQRAASGACLVDAAILDVYGGRGILGLDEPKQLDHVIPLSYAARHGGERWAPAAKKAYANELTYPHHLVMVGAAANNAKRDKGPKDWVPDNVARWCEYGTWWAVIAARWRLTPDPGDLTAIRKLTDTC